MEFDDITLKKIQAKELEILIFFDDFCRKNKIKYFLGGGTLLGAIRHSGFIPWDDDVDVMMDRENYDKLCRIAQIEMTQGRFFFQLPTTDLAYHDHMAKVRLEGTIYATVNNMNFKEMHKGFFIDIFAHDKSSKNKRLHKLHVFFTKFMRSMQYRKWLNLPMDYKGKYRFLCRVLTVVKYVLPINIIECILNGVLIFFNSFNTGVLYDGMGEHLDHGVFDEKILAKVIYVPFEGHMMPVPERYDEYLKFSYGDYMTLPPVEARKPHHMIAKIDFGE